MSAHSHRIQAVGRKELAGRPQLQRLAPEHRRSMEAVDRRHHPESALPRQRLPFLVGREHGTSPWPSTAAAVA